VLTCVTANADAVNSSYPAMDRREVPSPTQASARRRAEAPRRPANFGPRVVCPTPDIRRMPREIPDRSASPFRPRYQHECDPTFAEMVGQMAPEVTSDHMRMRSAARGVALWSAEYFNYKCRDVLGMMGIHRGKHRREIRVQRDSLVKSAHHRLKVFRSTRPCAQRWDFVLHFSRMTRHRWLRNASNT
jgi:hypothetical protein